MSNIFKPGGQIATDRRSQATNILRRVVEALMESRRLQAERVISRFAFLSENHGPSAGWGKPIGQMEPIEPPKRMLERPYPAPLRLV